MIGHKIVPNDTRKFIIKMLSDIEDTDNRKVITKWIFTDNVAMDKNLIEEFYIDRNKSVPLIIQVKYI